MYKILILACYLNIALVGYGQKDTLSFQLCSVRWCNFPLTCNAGSIESSVRLTALNNINYFRMRCGLPAVNLSDSLSEISQMAAFISHQNHKLSHTIDSDWRCFSEFASLACTNSLLGALGEYELQKKKLAVTSVFFKEPRSHNAFVGHRRWLMHPCLESIGYGSTKDYEAITPQLRVPCLRDTVYQYSYPPHGQINAQLVSEKWSWSVYPYEAIDSDSMRIEVRCQKRNIPIKILSKEKFLGDFTIVFQLKQLLKDNEISNEFLNKEIEVVISNYKINGIIEKSSYSVFINKNSDKED